MTPPSWTGRVADLDPPPTRATTPAGPGVRLTAVLLVLVTGVGAVLRFARIGDKSLWIDEAFSVWTSAGPLSSLWRVTVDLDFHPPLYYALLHVWLGFGDDEAALRSLSALLSVLTLPVVFLIGARIGGPVLGVLSSALVAVSPLQVAYAQQARMYALMTLSAALSILFLLLVLDPRPAGRPAPARRRRLHWAGFVLSTVLTMLSHNTGVLLPASIGLFVGLALLRSTHGDGAGVLRQPLTGLGGVATGLAAAVLLWLPWLPFFLSQTRRVDAEFWISSPSLATFLQHWHDLVHASGPPELQRGPVLLGVAVLVVLGLHRMRGSPQAALLLVVVVVPVALELLVSLRRPVFFTQTLVWTSVPFAVLLAAGVLHLRLRPLIAVVAGGVVLLDVLALDRYYQDDGKEDWRTATRYVAERVEARDLVLFDAAWGQIPFDYYYERSGGPVISRRGMPSDVLVSDVLEAKMTRAALTRLDGLTRGAPTVWVVFSHDWYTDPQGLVRSHLAGSFRAVDEREFRAVTVVRYDAGPS